MPKGPCSLAKDQQRPAQPPRVTKRAAQRLESDAAPVRAAVAPRDVGVVVQRQQDVLALLGSRSQGRTRRGGREGRTSASRSGCTMSATSLPALWISRNAMLGGRAWMPSGEPKISLWAYAR